MINQKTIPTFLAIVLLVIGIVAGVFLVQSDKIFETNASPDLTPQQVRITNTTDKSFAVSWVTDKQNRGFISYGNSRSLGMVIYQQANNPSRTSLVHHSVISNLTPNTTYYFKIGSGDQLFDNNGDLYEVKTAPQLPSLPTPDIIFGTVVDSSNNPAVNVVVYVNLVGAAPQSSLTDVNGKWSLYLSSARNTNLGSYANYSTDSSLEIFVQAGGGKVSAAKIRAGFAHPVPAIALGQNFDFSQVLTTPPGSLPNAQIKLP